MSDPLSLPVGALAIATVSLQTCEYLYRFFKTVTEAPQELEHHTSTLRALQATFTGIAKLEQDIPDKDLLSPGFEAHLQECLCDLQAMEQLVRPFHDRMKSGRRRRHWAKVRWASLDQKHELQKLLARTQAHQSTFSLDLLLLSIRLGIRSNEKRIDKSSRVSDASLLDSAPAISQRMDQDSQEHAIQNIQIVVQQEPTVSNHLSIGYNVNICSSLIWCGSVGTLPIDHKLWSHQNTGYGVSVATIHTSLLAAFRFQLAVYLFRRHHTSSLNIGLNWSFSIQRLIPSNASIVQHIENGNISHLQGAFSRKEFSPYDVLPDGTSLLQIACSNNQIAIVQLLLTEGADVNAMNSYGESPLHSAIELNDQYDITRLLLNHGGDLSNRNIAGKTPLHTFYSPVIGEILKYDSCYIDLGSRDETGRTVLHYLAWSSITTKTIFETHQSFVELNGGKVDNEGRGLLHLAAERGNISVVEYLLNNNPWLDINLRDNKLSTPLHYAVKSKRAPETLCLLVQRGASLDARDADGRSVLDAAIKAQNLIAVETLRDLGAEEAVALASFDGVDDRNISNLIRCPLAKDLDRCGLVMEEAMASKVSLQQPTNAHRSGARKRQKASSMQRSEVLQYVERNLVHVVNTVVQCLKRMLRVRNLVWILIILTIWLVQLRLTSFP